MLWIHLDRSFGTNGIIQELILSFIAWFEATYIHIGDYWLYQVHDTNNWAESWYVGAFLFVILSYFIFGNIFADQSEQMAELKA